MAIETDRQYNGLIKGGAWTKSRNKGTVGFEFFIKCDAGNIRHTAYLTEGTRESVERLFSQLGVSKEQLKNPRFMEFELARFIEDKPCIFETHTDTYGGKATIKVKWLAGMKQSDPDAAAEAASFFGGDYPSDLDGDIQDGIPPEPSDDNGTPF